MNYALEILNSVVKEESGQDLIEYALIAGLLGVGAVVTMKNLSNHITTAFTVIGTSLTNGV